MHFDPLHRWTEAEPWLEQALSRAPAERREFLTNALVQDDDLLRQVIALVERAEAQEQTSTSTFLGPANQALTDALAPESETLAEGVTFGPYRITGNLGEGGMANVFMAVRQNDELELPVAVKILRSLSIDDPIRARFLAEGHFLANLTHPGIARVLASGTVDDEFGFSRPYLALEYIEGEPIDQYCKNNAFSLQELLRLFLEVCDALAYAHGRFVVHRDLKPSNLLVTSDGQPKLLDFGIAKWMSTRADTSSVAAMPETRTHQRLLTPEYAAPEQLRGEEITAATDVWGLGIILYELVAGKRPFERTPSRSLEQAIFETAPKPPSLQRTITQQSEAMPPAHPKSWPSVRRTVGDLDTIILKALRKEPQHRYQSVSALGDDIERFLEGRTISARPQTVNYRLQKFAQRNPLVVGISAAAMIAVAVLLWGLWSEQRESLLQRDLARAQARQAEVTSDFLLQLFSANDPRANLGVESTAQELLESGIARMDSLAGEPLVHGQLLGLVGSIYSELGSVPRAIELLQESAQVFEGALDNVNESDNYLPKAALTYARLGAAELRVGNYDQAEAAFQRALALAENDLDLQLRALSGLGLTSQNRGDQAEALRRYEHAVETLGARRLEAGVPLLNNYGRALIAVGQHDDARKISQRALDDAEFVFEEFHPNIGLAASNLGVALNGLERHVEATPFLQRALAVQERVYGRNHFRYGQAATAVAAAYRTTGRFEESVETYQQALKTYEDTFGPDHLASALINASLAESLSLVERHNTAIETATRSVDVAIGAAGPKTAYVADAKRALGFAYRNNGDLDLAESTLNEALDLYRETLGPDSVVTAEGASVLGGLLVQTGRPDDALPLLEHAFKVQRDSSGPTHTSTLRTEFWRQLASERLSAQPELTTANGPDASSSSSLTALASRMPRQHAFFRWAEQAGCTATTADTESWTCR